jgi:hypothetical protein
MALSENLKGVPRHAMLLWHKSGEPLKLYSLESGAL